MASSSAAVLFTTKTPYALPSQKFMIPLDWKRYQLSQLINKALSLTQLVPFDFLVRGAILRTSLGECRAEHGISEEETLEVEYFESVLPPQRMTTLPHEDWVSSISCRLSRHFVTGSYDGHVRLFDYAQQLVRDVPAHQAPVTSVCLVPSPASTNDSESVLIASASHDLTASLTRVSLVPDAPPSFRTLASLHLHTSPLSSISSNHTGTHLLTASWDCLIGLWDTIIPAHDEVVPVSDLDSSERRKRRKTASGADQQRGKHKAPVTVLKSHTARVSKAAFAPGSNKLAYSCGFDSTVRTWDVESGVCVNTISVPERPMLDLVVTPDGHTALACSTDRTVSIFDLRSPSLASTAGTLMHPATPSCLVYPGTTPTFPPSADADGTSSPSAVSAPQVLTGAYDGIARLWDLRSLKSAIASFKAWNGDSKKILSVDWAGEVVGVGGEGGAEIWRVGQGGRVLTK